MPGIRNIRWIDHNRRARLAPIQTGGRCDEYAEDRFAQASSTRSRSDCRTCVAEAGLVEAAALARQRRQLASLSDEMLKDIGRSRADIEWEASRPFWDEPR